MMVHLKNPLSRATLLLLAALALLGLQACSKKAPDPVAEKAAIQAVEDSLAVIQAQADSLEAIAEAEALAAAELLRQEEELRRIEEEAREELEAAMSSFDAVYFDFDKHNLFEDTRDRLVLYAEILNRYPDLRLKLEGHCDENGSVDYNLALGERRARAVKDYLGNLGIEAKRLDTVSFGKSRPVFLGHNETAWSKNRRVEFRVLK